MSRASGGGGQEYRNGEAALHRHRCGLAGTAGGKVRGRERLRTTGRQQLSQGHSSPPRFGIRGVHSKQHEEGDRGAVAKASQ